MNILIVENERKAAAYLKKGLFEQGFMVDVANDGEDGLYCSITNHYDLIILDIRLPKMDGWSVIDNIRKENDHVPILLLTACDDIKDKIRGFDLGADDYLIKPFSFFELVARVRSLLKRSQIPTMCTLQVADLHIDIFGYKVSRNGMQIRLTAKEFNLLVLLAKRKGEYISKSLIAEQIWGINFDSGTNIIEATIKRLREKIDKPFNNKLIHNIRGMGYVLEER